MSQNGKEGVFFWDKNGPKNNMYNFNILES